MANPGKMAVNTTMLKPKEKKALKGFVRQLMENFPSKISLIALYGSKARGDSTPDSDIDILILVTQEDRIFRREIIDLASQFSLEYDVLLSPHVIGEGRFERKRGFTYYRNVAHDAIQLSIRRGKLTFRPGMPPVQGTST